MLFNSTEFLLFLPNILAQYWAITAGGVSEARKLQPTSNSEF